MNIIYLAVDTLRSDHLSCYGYSKLTGPNIDKISDKGVRFANSFSHSNCTQPGFTTISTGMYPITHNIIAHDGSAELQPGLLTTPEILKQLGYCTLAVDNLIHMRSWLGRGYDDYRSTTKADENPCNAKAEQVADMAIELIAQYKKDPFFLFIHFWDPHQPYRPPSNHDIFYTGTDEEARDPNNKSLDLWRKSLFGGKSYLERTKYTDAERIISLYDGEINYVDKQIGRILQKIKDLELTEKTLLVIFSDHGEIMNEPNSTLLGQAVRFCHLDLYDNVLRTPLILYHPERLPQGLVFDQLVQHVDILPTVLGIVGKKPNIEYELEGINLLPLIKGETSQTRDWIEISEHSYQPRCGIRTKEWKFIRIEHDSLALGYGRPPKELYNLQNDPEELQNVADVYPEITSKMEAILENWTQSQLTKWNKLNPFLTQPLTNMGLETIKHLLTNIRKGSQAEDGIGLRYQQGVHFKR